MDERLDAVRTMWATYRESGVEGAIPLLDPDVEFIDHAGRKFEGYDGIRAFFAEFQERGEEFMASPYTFELHEPDLIVVGHRRIRSAEGLRGEYLFFVHSCRDGRIWRLAAFTTKEAALADIDERAGR